MKNIISVVLLAFLLLAAGCGRVYEKTIPTDRSKWDSFLNEVSGLSESDHELLMRFMNLRKDMKNFPVGITVEKAINMERAANESRANAAKEEAERMEKLKAARTELRSAISISFHDISSKRLNSGNYETSLVLRITNNTERDIAGFGLNKISSIKTTSDRTICFIGKSVDVPIEARSSRLYTFDVNYRDNANLLNKQSLSAEYYMERVRFVDGTILE